MEEVERKTKEHGKGGQAGCKWVVNVLLPFKVLDILVAFFRVCLCQQQDRRTRGEQILFGIHPSLPRTFGIGSTYDSTFGRAF